MNPPPISVFQLFLEQKRAVYRLRLFGSVMLSFGFSFGVVWGLDAGTDTSGFRPYPVYRGGCEAGVAGFGVACIKCLIVSSVTPVGLQPLLQPEVFG